ncbi:TetR/AcrR family transcriptional regulator [Dokdonia sp.]|uniref:TetR/AcrR family transcriptional regulator n=1 Tax=Dokdonia sp. TaxID=2024995 RepID=UPI0032669B79
MKHNLVRQTIVETASRLFYENGYNLTGINEIIKEAGIAKATLYNHFRSKEEICIAYLHYKDQVFFEQLKAFLNTYPKGKKRVVGLFDFLTKFYEGDNFNGCWCLNTVSEIPKENEQIRKVIQDGKEVLINYIEELVGDSLELDKEGIKVIAKQIYLLYEGGLSESHLHQDVWPIKTAYSLCEKLIA